MKDVARGSAPVALLPSKETLSDAYFELRARIDQIVAQAQQQGSLAVALSGLNSIRHTLDSLARLAGHDRPAGTQVNVAVQTNVNVDLTLIAERLFGAEALGRVGELTHCKVVVNSFSFCKKYNCCVF
jgi:carbon monoxide dehydrogenase subunit G